MPTRLLSLVSFAALSVLFISTSASDAFAQISFFLEEIENIEADDISTVDMDGDGHLDVVGATASNGLVWWENDGSPGDGGWTRRTIDATFSALSIFVVDFDQDGHQDVLAAAQGELAWWENDGSPGDGGWTKHVIDASISLGNGRIRAANLDIDSDLEVYGAVGFAIAYWDFVGNAWFRRDIITNFLFASDALAVDMDGDSDLDLICAAYGEDDFLWAENDGFPTDGGWTAHIIDDSSPGIERVAVDDVDLDGDLDVFSSMGGTDGLMWWANDGTPEDGWVPHVIGSGALGSVLDIDLDGDLDVVSNGFSSVFYWENDGTPADGTWVEREVANNLSAISTIDTGDINGDGRPDVISAGNRLNWHSSFFTSIVVTNTNDDGPGSLRQVVSDAPAGITVQFEDSLAGQTITLTTGQITIDKNLSVDALSLASGGGVTISGNDASRLFEITTGQTVELKGLTLTDGFNSGSGGAILNSGMLTFNDSSIMNSTAPIGGGIHSTGPLTVDRSTIAGNTATHAGLGGGGIYTEGATSIIRSTFSGNMSDNSGGGLYTTATTLVTTSTFSGNTAVSSGGGITNNTAAGVLTLVNSTLYGNNAPDGSGLRNAAGSTAALQSSIIYSTLGGGDCSNSGTLSNNERMLIEDGSCSPALTGDPSLRSLGDYGGDTMTHPPRPGAAVIDAGSCNGVSSDQRFQGRPVNVPDIANIVDGCDIGAVEATIAEGRTLVTNTNGLGSGSLRDMIDGAASGRTITFDQNLDGATINVSNSGPGLPSLLIDKSLTIDATALANGVTISGDGARHVIGLTGNGSTLTLMGFTIQDGSNGVGPGGGIAAGLNTNLHLDRMTVRANRTTGSGIGGGIYFVGNTLIVQQSTISDNTSANLGGGVYFAGTTFSMEQTALTGNTGSAGGGIFLNSGSTTVSQSTISGNESTSGGGGGILNIGGLTLTQSTLSDNIASQEGGGLFNGGVSILSGSIVAGNSGASTMEDCAGTITSNGYNVIGNGTGCPANATGDVTVNSASVFTDVLWPLANNGGATQTHMLRPGSPAIDAIPADGGSKTSALGCGTTLTTDQRGLFRPVDLTETGCDIGSVEVQSLGELPVELVAFEAVRDGQAVVLSWKTASETNNAGFHVERHAGNDATETEKTWNPLGFVKGYGTTAEPQSYTFRAETLAPGLHTFRLKQIDYDGTFAYSPQVEVLVGVVGAYHLSAAYPNPFNPRTQFSLAVARTQQVDIAVYDMLGRRVYVLFRGEMAENQTRAFVWEAIDQPSGLYFIRVVGERFSETHRVTLVK